MAAPPSHMWYVKAAGGVWGPYPEARVCAFVAEGRVRSDTPVSPWAEGPFAPAAANVEFAALFQAARAQAQAQAQAPEVRSALGGASPAKGLLAAHAPIAAGSSVAAAAPAPAETAPAAAGRALLVWADLSARSVPGFHAALAATGPGVTIRPGLWLVQARMGAAALRNELSRRLNEADMLLVVEAPLQQAAWFNLDPARDRDLRRLWSA